MGYLKSMFPTFQICEIFWTILQLLFSGLIALWSKKITLWSSSFNICWNLLFGPLEDQFYKYSIYDVRDCIFWSLGLAVLLNNTLWTSSRRVHTSILESLQTPVRGPEPVCTHRTSRCHFLCLGLVLQVLGASADSISPGDPANMSHVYVCIVQKVLRNWTHLPHSVRDLVMTHLSGNTGVGESSYNWKLSFKLQNTILTILSVNLPKR